MIRETLDNGQILRVFGDHKPFILQECRFNRVHFLALRKLDDTKGISIYVMDLTEIMDEIKNDGIEKPEKIRMWV